MAVKGDPKLSNAAAENAQQAKLHPERKYSLVDWVCSQMIYPVTCMKGEKCQGQTYAQSAAIEVPSTSQPTSKLESRSHPKESSGFLNAPPCREKSASDSNLSKIPKEKPEEWNWMGLKAALKVRSADLNVLAPQSL